jgi:hypothetical protein
MAGRDRDPSPVAASAEQAPGVPEQAPA